MSKETPDAFTMKYDELPDFVTHPTMGHLEKPECAIHASKEEVTKFVNDMTLYRTYVNELSEKHANLNEAEGS